VITFITETAVFIALAILIMKGATGTHGGSLFSGCFLKEVAYFYVVWIPPVLFESVIIVMTLYKVVQFQKTSPSPLIYLLARDSLVYFVIMFSFLLANLLLARFGRGFLNTLLIVPSTVVACIAASRMSMNMREFVMENHGATLTMNPPEGATFLFRPDTIRTEDRLYQEQEAWIMSTRTTQIELAHTRS